MNILKFIIKRLIEAIPVLIMVSILSFFIIRLSPSDPLSEMRLNPTISQETINYEIKRLKLDKPIYVQYFYWMKGFIKGDLGYTTNGEKVSQKLKERIPNTLLLSVVVIFFTWTMGVPLGILAASNQNKPLDKTIIIMSTIGMAIPSFFLALLFLMFAVKTGGFPVGGLTSYNFSNMSFLNKLFDIAHHIFLPALTLIIISLSSIVRQMRGNLLDVLNSDYLKFAKAKGLSNFKILYKHALRNALNPMISLLGFEFASLLSGAALTEYVFQYPGLGRLILEAVLRTDTNLIMASLMLGTIMLIVGNLIADILLKLLDPRIN